MTNAEIIFREQQARAARGELQYTGRVARFRDPAGQVIEVREVEPIHTFAKWKELNRAVRKGEHAAASFTIWKAGKERKAEESTTEEEVRLFMKKAHFFTYSQTEPLAEKKKA